MNYKEGDKVIIFKPSGDILKKWSNTWIRDMDKYIGEEATISNIDEHQFSAFGWRFPTYILENQNTEPQYEIY